jgi:Fic family protein
MRSRYVDIEDRSEDLKDLLADEPEIARDFFKRYELSWLYHDSALEGVVLTGLEMAMALAYQPVAEATSVALHREVQNQKTAIDYVRAEAAGKKLRINLTVIKKIYETLGAAIEGKSSAEYRKEIPLHRAYFHEIAPPAKIPFLLGKLVDFCESSEFRSLHPIQKASRVSHAFMQIYPFTENSGKVARLLANQVLLHHGYQPCIIHATDRQRYYESLRLPEAALRDLMLDAIENGIANAEKYVRATMEQRAKKAAR